MAIPLVFQLPRQTALNLGVVASGAKAYFFEAETTTPQATYTTAALTTQHSHPVVADAAGLFPIIYLDDELQYRVQIKTAGDVLIYDEDEINDPNNRAPFYPQTQAEIDAGVTPSDTKYLEGDVRRYGATGDRITDDTTAIQQAFDVAANAGLRRVFFPAGKYRVTSTITISAHTLMVGIGLSVNYANTTRDGGSQIHIDMATTDNAFEMSGSQLNGFGVEVAGLKFTSHSNTAATDLTGETVNAFYLNNVFSVYFRRCVFEHLNVTQAIETSGSCNVIVADHCYAALIGDTTGTLISTTGGFTYGTFADLSAAPDSWVDTCFIEKCGEYGVKLANDSKVYNSWIDLCLRGVQLNGKNNEVIGGSIKHSQTNAIVANTSAVDWIVNGTTLKYNNRANGTGVGADTFAIRLNSSNTGWQIVNVDAVDELVSGHTEFQNFLYCGSAGNAGYIDNVNIGDVATSGQRLYDPNGNIASGLIVIGRVHVEGHTKSTEGLSLPANVVTTVRGKIVGDSSSNAVTTDDTSVLSGDIISKSCGTLFDADFSALGPTFYSESAPTTIVNKSGGAGAVGIQGFAHPVAINHTGGGTETLNMVALPSRVTGRIWVSYGDGGSEHFVIAATIHWDGTTLTISGSVTANAGFGVPSLVDNSGTLAISVSKASSESGNAILHFSGYWLDV